MGLTQLPRGWGRCPSAVALARLTPIVRPIPALSAITYLRENISSSDRMNWVADAFDTLYNQPSWYFGSAVTSVYLLYYLFEVAKKPIIATSPKGKFRTFIEKNMPILKEKFWPTFWCIESRLQTVLATFVRVSILPQVPYKREILSLKDGGEVGLDTLDPSDNCPANVPTIIILPGLTGGSHSDYVKGLSLVSKDIGMRVVVFNQRGIGGLIIKTPRTYCASNSEDLTEVIEHLKKKYEGAPLAAVGISMGGLVLGNYLTSDGIDTSLSCAMIISVPWDVHLGARSIETPVLNLMLNRHLASCLCDIVRRMRPILEKGGSFVTSQGIDACLKAKTIREFDRHFTIKQFGYKDVDDYYNHASLHDKIHKVTIPTLCLSAADDPFQPLNGIPIDVANEMENLCIVVTSRGGHIGFMEGLCPVSKDQYMFRLFGQFFQAMLKEDGIAHFT